MLIEAARQVFLAVVSRVLGDTVSDQVRGRNGSITLPLSVLEDAFAAHVQIVSESIDATRSLSEAILVMQRHNELVLIEAPTIAVRMSQTFLERNGLGLESPSTPASEETPAVVRQEQIPTTDPSASAIPPQDTEQTAFRRRMRDAYPAADLEFFE